MKLRLFILSIIALLLAACTEEGNYTFKDVVTRTGAFDARGTVILENVNGSIHVRTWDKNEILIEAEKSAPTDAELQAIDLKIDLSESSASIKVHLPKRSGDFFGKNTIRGAVRFTLTVPATVSLAKISSTNSSITLDGIRGPVNASAVNGSVHATQLGGNAKFTTVNGEIKAGFSNVSAQQKLSFNTVNGEIVVSLPQDAGVELHGSVVNGQIDCDFPMESNQEGRRRNLSGKIGDGRAKLDAETVNGRIHIKSL